MLKLLNLTSNTYKSERVQKSTVRTEVHLVEKHNIIVPETALSLETNEK